MSEIILSTVIGVLSGFIGVSLGGYFLLKRAKTEIPNMLLDAIEELTPELPKLLAKEEIRQFVYSLGVLAGNGAKAGALGGVGKGKFKFEDLLGQILPSLLPKILGQGNSENSTEIQPTQKW